MGSCYGGSCMDVGSNAVGLATVFAVSWEMDSLDSCVGWAWARARDLSIMRRFVRFSLCQTYPIVHTIGTNFRPM